MYDALAIAYDRFMKNVDYDKWIDFVAGLIGERRSGIDFGCGTGKFTIALRKKGKEIMGVDLSSNMLSYAFDNAHKENIFVNFVQGDVSNFEFLKKVDFVTAMCDTINYIQNPIKAFQNIFNNLNFGGIFVCDISSEYKLTKILANNTYSDTNGDITYIWQNFLGSARKKLVMELTFFKAVGKLYEKSFEQQVQYVHKALDIEKCLKDVGFDRVEVKGEFYESKPSATSQRIHFIAYKS